MVSSRSANDPLTGRAFDDCLVTESIFKLLQIFGNLIQRNLIALELSDRMPLLVTMLNQEMDESKVIYSKQMSRIAKQGRGVVDRNMPAMAGQLKWAQELKKKMSFSVKAFKVILYYRYTQSICKIYIKIQFFFRI